MEKNNWTFDKWLANYKLNLLVEELLRPGISKIEVESPHSYDLLLNIISIPMEIKQ